MCRPDAEFIVINSALKLMRKNLFAMLFHPYSTAVQRKITAPGNRIILTAIPRLPEDMRL